MGESFFNSLGFFGTIFSIIVFIMGMYVLFRLIFYSFFKSKLDFLNKIKENKPERRNNQNGENKNG